MRRELVQVFHERFFNLNSELRTCRVYITRGGKANAPAASPRRAQLFLNHSGPRTRPTGVLCVNTFSV